MLNSCAIKKFLQKENARVKPKPKQFHLQTPAQSSLLKRTATIKDAGVTHSCFHSSTHHRAKRKARVPSQKNLTTAGSNELSNEEIAIDTFAHFDKDKYAITNAAGEYNTRTTANAYPSNCYFKGSDKGLVNFDTAIIPRHENQSAVRLHTEQHRTNRSTQRNAGMGGSPLYRDMVRSHKNILLRQQQAPSRNLLSRQKYSSKNYLDSRKMTSPSQARDARDVLASGSEQGAATAARQKSFQIKLRRPRQMAQIGAQRAVRELKNTSKGSTYAQSVDRMASSSAQVTRRNQPYKNSESPRTKDASMIKNRNTTRNHSAYEDSPLKRSLQSRRTPEVTEEEREEADESMSRMTLRENKAVQQWIDRDLTRNVAAGHKDVSLNETNLSIQRQKKLMRMMKQQIQSVLGNKSSQNQFDAFDIEDEDFEKRMVKVGMNEHNNLVQSGRLKIKNRIKDFTVTALKTESTAASAVKIFVSVDDLSFKTSSEYQLIKEAKVVMNVPIGSPNPHKYVYFKIVQDEDDIGNESDEAVAPQTGGRSGASTDKFIKVLFNFGINNYNKLVAQQLVQKARQARQQNNLTAKRHEDTIVKKMAAASGAKEQGDDLNLQFEILLEQHARQQGFKKKLGQFVENRDQTASIMYKYHQLK